MDTQNSIITLIGRGFEVAGVGALVIGALVAPAGYAAGLAGRRQV